MSNDSEEKDIGEMCRDVFKFDMRTSDEMTKLVQTHSEQDIEDAVFDAVEDISGKVTSDRRKLVLFSTCVRIGQVIDSKDLQVFGQRGIERVSERHG